MMNTIDTDKLVQGADELDYNAIGAMLCGQELTDSQKDTVDEFNRQHDAVAGLRQ